MRNIKLKLTEHEADLVALIIARRADEMEDDKRHPQWFKSREVAELRIIARKLEQKVKDARREQQALAAWEA